MRIVIGLGTTALLERGEAPDAGVQYRHLRHAAQVLARLTFEHELVICHGSAAQVGLLALESEADGSLSTAYPLDVLGAQTQGMLGYWLVQQLRNCGVSRQIAAILTQTVVDTADPAFAEPRKFIGPGYRKPHAQLLAMRHGWQVGEDGSRWRRLVPSPQPESIVELGVIRQLVDAGTVVVCCGGGGVPVTETDDGELTGIAAVVDKDLTAGLLARNLHADLLLMLTDVPCVMRDFGTDHPFPLRTVDLTALSEMTFARGSMGPKVEACARFVEATGHKATIGALAEAADLIAGKAGTTICRAIPILPEQANREPA